MAKGSTPQAVTRFKQRLTWGLGLAALLIVGAGLYPLFAPLGPPKAGEHYTDLGAPDRSPRGPVTVVEFFSYGCVHCKNFDPQIERWTKGLPEDVRFKRAPVAFSASWGLLAKAYHAAERLGILEANHQRLFSALHDAGLALNTEDAMVQFFDGHGTDGRSFRRALRDPAVEEALAEDGALARRYGIRAVPTLVVDGRYRIDDPSLSRQQILQVADALITTARAARTP
ncbi:MAG: thiol:disulfide interchange protein DsbA/DsbL [Pseudomonadota bacterium]|jgi:thiol:disulfide interchange protein DsbA|nr:thiol:disulfide interchange protein DsbA/DsbL [Pseudomonadota bacterium]